MKPEERVGRYIGFVREYRGISVDIVTKMINSQVDPTDSITQEDVYLWESGKTAIDPIYTTAVERALDLKKGALEEEVLDSSKWRTLKVRLHGLGKDEEKEVHDKAYRLAIEQGIIVIPKLKEE